MWILKYCGNRLCAIQGFCISFSSTLAKAKTHQFTQLENKIQSLQNLQKQHFTDQQATQLSPLKEEYDLLSHSKAEFILHRTRQKYYFESERPSHLLALRLKECESKAYISAIKSSDDQVTMNPVAINEIFKGFYTNLYKAETDFDESICKQYLDKLELPRISQMDKESLEAPLSLEELHVSLKRGSGVWPSMVTHTRNLSSAFNPSKCTLTAVNTHLEPSLRAINCNCNQL